MSPFWQFVLFVFSIMGATLALTLALANVKKFVDVLKQNLSLKKGFLSFAYFLVGFFASALLAITANSLS